jgi:hypothetical protein
MVPLVNRVRVGLSIGASVAWSRPTAECVLVAPLTAGYEPGFVQPMTLEFAETW